MATAGNQGGSSAGSPQRTDVGGTSHRPQPQSQQTTPGGVVEAATQKVQEMASSAASQAGKAWESTRRGVQEMTSQVTSGAEEAWGSMNDFMRRYPIPVFLAGIGIGFLLARVFDYYPTDMTRRMSQSSANG